MGINVGSQPGVYRSEDGGLSWTYSNTGIGAPEIYDFSFNPTDPGQVVVATGGAGAGGVYRSTDGGRTWIQTSSLGRTRSVSWSPADPSKVYALTDNTPPLRSDDGGLAFGPVASSPGVGLGIRHRVIRVHPTDPTRVFWGGNISCSASDSGQAPSLELSDDSGDTWTQVFTPACSTGEGRVMEVLFDPSNPNQVVIGINNNSTGPIYGTGGHGIWLSETGGVPIGTSGWEQRTNGIWSHRVGQVETDLAGGLWFHGVALSFQKASSPSSPATALIGPLEDTEVNLASVIDMEVLLSDPLQVHELGDWWYMDVGGTYLKTTHDGATSNWVPPGNIWEPPTLVGVPILVVANHGSGNALYVWTWSGPDKLHVWTWSGPDKLHRSFDGGANYTFVGSFFKAMDAVIDPTDDNRLFAITNAAGAVQLSTDAGETWSPRSTGLPTDSPVALKMDRSDADHLLAVFANEGPYESTDGGLSWTVVPHDLQGEEVTAADWDPDLGRVFLATEAGGVYITGFGFQNDGLGTRLLETIEYSIPHEVLLVGTYRMGVRALSVPRQPVAAPSDLPQPTPSQVLAASPNPFLGETAISFVLSSRASVRVSIHDVLGRRVATLVNGERDRGGHSVMWNGRDASGREVAAGVYFARLRAGSFSATRKMVLRR
jgi:photosystem II stability/assembly factor-like uncharacterized protein